MGRYVSLIGHQLRGVLKCDLSKTEITNRPSPSTNIVIKAYPKTLGTIGSWEKADFRTIKGAIRVNVEVTGPDGKLNNRN